MPLLDSELSTFFKNVKVEDIHYSTLAGTLAAFSSDYNSAKVVLGLLNSVVVIVISISIVLLYIIFLMQRSNEFGLLGAIGYSRAFIVRKVLLESAMQVLLGWGFGLLLSQAVYTFFNTSYFRPHGLLGVNVFAPVPLLFSLPIPTTVIVVTTLTVCLQLGRLDPISIIEKRD
jgi:ABC-type antimicrobial peptide transport system permease subunit